MLCVAWSGPGHHSMCSKQHLRPPAPRNWEHNSFLHPPPPKLGQSKTSPGGSKNPLGRKLPPAENRSPGSTKQDQSGVGRALVSLKWDSHLHSIHGHGGQVVRVLLVPAEAQQWVMLRVFVNDGAVF